MYWYLGNEINRTPKKYTIKRNISFYNKDVNKKF